MPCGAIAHIGIVCHNNNGFSLSVQLFENIHHIAAVALVQTARRLIRKDNVGGFCDDFCQCHPLLLTAAQGVDLTTLIARKPHLCQRIRDAFFLCLALCFTEPGGELHVGFHGVGVHQSVILKQVGQLVPPQMNRSAGGKGRVSCAAEGDAAAVRRFQQAYDVQESCFSGSAFALDGDKLSGFNMQRVIPKQDFFPEAFIDIG